MFKGHGPPLNMASEMTPEPN